MQTFKCVIVGDNRGGRDDAMGSMKTTLLVSYTTNKFPSEYVPTVFDNLAVTIMIGGEPYTLGLFDTVDQEDYDRLRPLTYPQTDVFIAVFSVVVPETFENIKTKWIPEITHHCPRTPILLCGLEIDIRDNEAILERLAKVGQKPITAEAGRKLARQLNLVKYVECSALTQKGLKNVFDEAILAALEPPEPIAKKFEFHVPTTVKKIFKNFRRKKDKVDKEVEQQDGDQLQSAKESQKILDDALKQGYVLLKNFIALMVGTPGVGKTCLKCLLMGRQPPNVRTSTICAEHPIKIRSVSLSQFQKLHGKWTEVSSDKLLPMIGRFIRKNAKRLEVEIPPELNAYLELLEGSTTAAASEMVSTSSRSTVTSGLATVASKLSSSCKAKHESSYSPKEAVVLVDSMLGSLEKLIAGVELTEEEEDELMSSVWIYFTDSGGQPQFHELLPLFIHDVSSVIIVSRLSDRLDDHPPDEFYQDGQIIGKKSSTHLTTTEQIKCLTSSLLSRSCDDGDIPDIIMVGTHRDKAHECPESIEEKDEKLLKILGPELRDHLLFYSVGERKLLHPVNTIDPNDLDMKVAEMIRVAVETSKLGKEVKVPIWWFVLELLIQGLAKKLRKRVLSREQCVGIANALGFSERSFNAALRFFSELNIIKYFDALPEVVFVDSQVPLDNVSDLVRERYLLQQGSGSCSRRGNWERFCKEGVVTPDFMDSTCKHFEKGVFESPQLLKLLQDQLVLEPLNAEEYFMPALLDVLSHEELEKHRVFSSPVSPLLFCFACGCRRAGIFCCLVVHLMKKSKWSIWHANGRLISAIARNCITFRLSKPSCLVTLIDAFYVLEVHIAANTKASVCQDVCPTIRKEILAGIEAASEALHYSEDRPELGVFCPCSECTSEGATNSSHHAAILVEDECVCTCVETSVSIPLSERQTIWLDQRPTTSVSSANQFACSPPIKTEDAYVPPPISVTVPADLAISTSRLRPSDLSAVLSQLCPACSKWFPIGCLLGIDIGVLEAIKKDYRDVSLEFLVALLTAWLRGVDPKPTWKALVDVLHQVGVKVNSEF